MLRIALALILGWIAGGAFAAPGDTLYVAERLYLSLSAEPSADAQRVRLLPSGEALQELSRQGEYIEVQLEDGTRGWVRESFVTNVTPNSLRVTELQSRVEQLQARISELQENPSPNPDQLERLSGLQQENATLREQLEQSRTRLDQLQAATEDSTAATDSANRIETLQQENENLGSRLGELQAELARLRDSETTGNEIRPVQTENLKIRWIILAGVGLLLLGAVAGYSWRSRQVRRRLHGLEL